MAVIDTLAVSRQLRAEGVDITTADGFALVLDRVLASPSSQVHDLKVRMVQMHWQIKTVLFLLMANLSLSFAHIAIEVIARK